MIFRYLARTRTGEDAGSELEANASRIKSRQWPYAVIELYLGKRQPSDTLAAAIVSGAQCEANFYTGEWYILQDRKSEAESLLSTATATCPKDYLEYMAAQAELKRLNP